MKAWMLPALIALGALTCDAVAETKPLDCASNGWDCVRPDLDTLLDHAVMADTSGAWIAFRDDREVIYGSECPDGCASIENLLLCDLYVNLVYLPSWPLVCWADPGDPECAGVTGSVLTLDNRDRPYHLCVNVPDACWSRCESNPGVGGTNNVRDFWGDCDGNCTIDLRDFAILTARIANSQ